MTIGAVDIPEQVAVIAPLTALEATEISTVFQLISSVFID